IFDHILGHRYFMGVEQGRQVPLPEAAASWYDTVYRPVMEVARRHDLAAHLPGWTETDIYLALTRLWLDLEQEGRPPGPEQAAAALLEAAAPYAPAGSRRGGGGRRPRRPPVPRRPAAAGGTRRRLLRAFRPRR